MCELSQDGIFVLLDYCTYNFALNTHTHAHTARLLELLELLWQQKIAHGHAHAQGLFTIHGELTIRASRFPSPPGRLAVAFKG